MMMPIHCDRCC